MPSMGSIDAYIYSVNQIPMLTATQEIELATKFHRDGDIEAARQLVLSHLRLVTFAVHWIKAEIHEFVLRNWRIVKIATTKAQRKLFFNLRRATKKLNWFSNEEVLHIAQELKVDPKEVRAMEARMSSYDVSFDSHSDDEDDCLSNPVHYLEADTKNPVDELADFEFDNIKTERLTKVLASFDQRSREILEARWLKENKATLHELAAKYNISAERVRQIEEGVMKKLKKELSSF